MYDYIHTPPIDEQGRARKLGGTFDIVTSESKSEVNSFSTNMKKLMRKLKPDFKCSTSKELITLDSLCETKVFIIGAPRATFSQSEIESLKQYLNIGGSVWVMLSEGGETTLGNNLNDLLGEFGITANRDSVIRITAHKQFHHPKNACISDGVLSNDLSRVASGRLKAKEKIPGLSFLYPFGCTLDVHKPAVPVLCSGRSAFPISRSLAAAVDLPLGRLLVTGSCRMFDDENLEICDNGKIAEIFISWLLRKNDCEFTARLIEEISEKKNLPNTATMAETFRACLEETEDIPLDPTKLAVKHFFNYDNSLNLEIANLYRSIGLKQEPLSLIPPNLSAPLPDLDPAVFPPLIEDIAPPPLELFDLDDAFTSNHVKLAQLANKCNNEDLEFFCRQAGDITGLHFSSAKEVLTEAFKKISDFKKN